MSLQGEKTRALFRKASQYMPYGVNSNFRYWGEEDTMVISRGEGTYIWDADDKRYIDYRLAFGPIILGHSYPAVVKRVQEAIQHGHACPAHCPRPYRAGEIHQVRGPVSWHE